MIADQSAVLLINRL